MQLINTDGLAFLGPGSEWFWMMLQFGVVAITFIAIYRQLRAQRSASVFEQMASWPREWFAPPFQRERLEFLLELERREVAAGLPRSAERVGDFFERLGNLVARGHFQSRDAWDNIRPPIASWWRFMGPYIERQRVIDRNPHFLEWFEALEREMQRLDLRLDGKPYLGHTTLAQEIDNLTAALQRERDATLGVIPTRKVALAPEAAAHD